jgi:uncharacterized membrane protein
MDSTTVLALAFAIGLLDGLRSLSAPAIVCWAARWRWIGLEHSPLAFLGVGPVPYIFTVLALGELVVDKLPNTPSRKAALGLIARIVLGGLSGAALCAAGKQSLVWGAVLGALGGVAGAFGGYAARTGLVRRLKAPDIVIALLEDVVAIGGGLLVVSRF